MGVFTKEKVVPAYYVARIRVASSAIREELRKIEKKVEQFEQADISASHDGVQRLLEHFRLSVESMAEVKNNARVIGDGLGGLLKIKIDQALAE